MQPLRPNLIRRGNSQGPPVAWVGAMTSPNRGVPAGAVDYFHDANAQVRSWRAAQNLSLVAGGRCLVSLGIGGVTQAFVPGPLDADRPPAVGPSDPAHLGRTDYHAWLFALGSTAAVIGILTHVYGIHRFYNDTSRISKKRAHFVGFGALIGAVLIAAGSAQAAYAIINQDPNAPWEALPIRAVGNFLVFACLPASFSASEIVHGQLPIPHRIQVRDIALAVGGACLLTSTQIALPNPPAPLWAREIAQVSGILGVALGSALPRVDALNAQAMARGLVRAQGRSVIAD